MLKKHVSFLLGSCICLSSLVGCNGNSESKEPVGDIVATVYNNSEVVAAEATDMGDVYSWQAQVFTPSGGNNDMETNNALIKSPWHTLKINGKSVPVYTARCGKGSHSFAWVDVATNKNDFLLEVELTMDTAYGKCVVLPENKGVEAEIDGKTYTAYIEKYGSYTYTFNHSVTDEVTDPTLAPLTLMVTEETPLEVPSGYEKVEIEPGYHEDMDLEFTEEETVYVMKSGLHEISSIRVPSNSILYIERGAYLQVTDRQDEHGVWNTRTAIHTEDTSNVQIISRGLLDCGKVLGGDNKRKHVVGASRSEELTIEGLTIINSNTWTMCLYNCDNAKVNRNLLLGYRTYSDGIMMSECRDSVGRYNFVRTGDDGIEFKGTGWGGSTVGSNCVYEYNDVWTDKGAAYGLTWESECDMENMVFRNNNVGFAQPTWAGRCNVLDCRLGTNENVTWSGIRFENIEIYYVISPNVMMTQLSGKGANLADVLFKNITVKSTELGVYAYQMYFGSAGGSIENVTLQNINFCGKVLTSDDIDNPMYFKFEANDFKNELTVK